MLKFLFYLKYAWRSVKRDRKLSLFAIVCVSVGVATLVALQSLTVSIHQTLAGDIQTRAGGDVVANVNFSQNYQLTLSPKAQSLLDTLKNEGKLTDWTGFNSHSIQITGYFNVPPTLYIIDPARFPLYGNIPLLAPAGGNFQQLLAEPNTIIVSKLRSANSRILPSPPRPALPSKL